MTLLLLYVGLALGVSFLCSLLEATLLASALPTLMEQEARGSHGAALLLEIKQQRSDDAISSILILNTVANTLGATLAGAQAARIFGSAWVGLFSGILTLLILVISEIIPKTIGAYYSRALADFVGRALATLTWIAAPALLLSRALTGLITRGRTSSFSRGELAATIETATEEGAISPAESRIFANLLQFDEVRIEDVMTPRTVTVMMESSASVADLLADSEAEAFSRIPLYRESRDNVVGYVLQREVLKAIGEGQERSQPLSGFRRDISFIPELASVGGALRQILERREPIAMAVDEHGGIAGLVTLEDLTETILGVEIVDESDQVVDLRRKAVELRDRRLERRRQRPTHHRDEGGGP